MRTYIDLAFVHELARWAEAGPTEIERDRRFEEAQKMLYDGVDEDEATRIDKLLEQAEKLVAEEKGIETEEKPSEPEKVEPALVDGKKAAGDLSAQRSYDEEFFAERRAMRIEINKMSEEASGTPFFEHGTKQSVISIKPKIKKPTSKPEADE